MKNIKTYSAGGLVFNSRYEILVVQEYGYYWGLPRGHIEPDETPLAAAIREIKEETGLTKLEYKQKLGSYQRYRFDKNGNDNKTELKNIIFFLFTTKESILAPQDTSITSVKWVNPDEASRLFIHKKDIDFYESVLKSSLEQIQKTNF